MSELYVLYIFLAVLVFNVLGTFIYVTGLDGLRLGLRKAFRSYRR